MSENQFRTNNIPPKGKLVAAGIIFVAGFLSPVLIPLVTTSNLSAGWKTTLSGLLALGIPELFMIIAAAVAGKQGLNYIKNKLFNYIKRYGPSDAVSKIRYRTGLVMFTIPIIVGWLLPYFTHLIPTYEENKYLIIILGDVLLISSLFVLGGDFWDKLRSLFMHDAKIIFPNKVNGS